MWLVAFVDPKSGIKSKWNKAALELKGKVKMGKVQNKVISENLLKLYGVASFPTILYFPEGDKSDPNTFEKYEGAITAKDIVSWALNRDSKKHKGEPTGKYRSFFCLAHQWISDNEVNESFVFSIGIRYYIVHFF